MYMYTKKINFGHALKKHYKIKKQKNSKVKLIHEIWFYDKATKNSDKRGALYVHETRQKKVFIKGKWW